MLCVVRVVIVRVDRFSDNDRAREFVRTTLS